MHAKVIAVAALFVACSCDDATAPGDVAGARVLWQVSDISGRGNATLDGSSIFITDANRVVHALDRSSGVRRWSVMPTNAGSLGGSHAADGNVLLAVGPMVALDAASGAERWRTQRVDGIGTLGMAVHGTTIVPSSFKGVGELVGLAISDGRELWRTAVLPTGAPHDTAESVRIFTPTIANSAVAASFTRWRGSSRFRGGIALVDVATGTLRWSTMLPVVDTAKSTFPSTAGAGSGLVVVTSEEGFVYAYDFSTGTLRWTGGISEVPAGGEPSYLDTRPVAIVGGSVLVGSGRGVLTMYSAASGRREWVAYSQQGAVTEVTPFGDGRALLRHFNGALSVFDANTGQELWSYIPRDGDAGRVYSAVVAGDSLFTSTAGGVTAFVVPR